MNYSAKVELRSASKKGNVKTLFKDSIYSLNELAPSHSNIKYSSAENSKFKYVIERISDTT